MARQTVPDQPKELKGIWKPTPADAKREGEYLRIEPPREGKEKFGESYVILEPSGQELKLPDHAGLKQKLRTLKVGWYVWISFIGKENKTFLYNVEYDPEYKRQAKLDEPPAIVGFMKDVIDPAGKILRNLKKAPAGLLDAPFWDMASKEVVPMASCIRVVDKLKAEGKIIQDGSTWRATA